MFLPTNSDRDGMILWSGFRCVHCGAPVTDKTADLYINPDGIVAICKNAITCKENRANATA